MQKTQNSLQIGALLLENPFILAPLAGYTDLPFRRLCREYGAGLCYSEMISSHGLVYRQQNTLALLASEKAERPVAMQLFGSDPEIMAEAAAVISEQPVDLIDINMGCPVKKVIKKGAGAALMKDPRRAAAIISKVVARTHLPVSVKIRTGWNHTSIIAADFARMAEEAGAQAVAVHARTWTDGFSGETDWQEVGRVKQAVNIPVIGNGDISSFQDGLARQQECGCDAVMIGRAALGNPWVFQPTGGPPSLHRRLTALRRHLELITRYQDPDRVLAKTKNHAGKYFKGHPRARAIRQRVYEVRSFGELQELVQSLLAQC